MAIGRPRQFDENKSLNSAMLHFWQHGYMSTSMQDLLDCTGMSKSSLYQSFGNKSKLFSTCLTRYQGDLIAELEQQLACTDSGLAFIQNLLDAVIAEAAAPQRKGCLLVNTANELAGNDPEVSRAIERGFARIRKVIVQALQKAQRNQEVSVDMNTELMADFIVSGISGLRTMVKSGASHSRLKAVSKILLTSLK
jgi:AcrR family transcriptional regulator